MFARVSSRHLALRRLQRNARSVSMSHLYISILQSLSSKDVKDEAAARKLRDQISEHKDDYALVSDGASPCLLVR